MERLGKGWCRPLCKGLIGILAILMIVSIFVFATPKVEAETTPRSSHIVMEKLSGRVLSGDNIYTRLPMASTTKIMTALVAVESDKMQDKVAITHDMVGIEGSSIYLEEGEELTIEELLYGLMLRSGNDSAVAIATHVGGSIDAFVDMMNERARGLNLDNTHFTNPHGLHDDNHYTSAFDLATIARVALLNETFKKIVSTKSIVIGGDTSKKRYLVNKNKMLRLYDGATGIKTGFTKKAGRCLVSSAERNGMEVISVVLNEPNMWEYSMNCFDNAFRDYRLLQVLTKDQSIAKVDIKGKTYDVAVKNNRYYPIKEDEREKLTYKLLVTSNKKNIQKDENIGKLSIYYDKHLLFEEKIYTM